MAEGAWEVAGGLGSLLVQDATFQAVPPAVAAPPRAHRRQVAGAKQVLVGVGVAVLHEGGLGRHQEQQRDEEGHQAIVM